MAIRVLVVDDSIVFRTKLQLSLSKDEDITVIGCAVDVAHAKILLNDLNPDMMVLDVEMPGMNGIQFLRELLPNHPIPVVVISSSPNQALDALDAGAVEFVAKPVAGQINGQQIFIDDLIAIIKGAVKAKVRRSPIKVPVLAPSTSPLNMGNKDAIIAIGASTGGTEAILSVIRDLPATTPGIVIVQHMPPVFTAMYAQRVDKICKMSVKEAQNNDRVSRGKVIIAAGDAHMTLKKDAQGYYIQSKAGPKVSGHCPSVDVLFQSVAEVAGQKAIGVILTGMGADGANGMKSMYTAGAYTIGQDKETCVVYGMPMEAYKRGGVSRQLPLDKICNELIARCKK